MEAIAQSRMEDRMAPKTSHVPALGVPPAVIGRALTSGGNDSRSLERIVAFFQSSPTGSAAASFLEKEFGEGGKGITIAGQKYALWFSKEGLRIAPGRAARTPGSTLVPWINAAAQVANLLQDGMFASQEVIDRARDNEFQEVAEKLWFLRQNFSDRAREQGFLPAIDALYGGFPDSTARIAEQLRDPSAHRTILAELNQFAAAYQQDSSLLRFRVPSPSKELLIRVSSLSVPPAPFTAVPDFAPEKGSFVTQDEIDRMLRGGGNVSGNKLKIYSYFVQGHDARECASFLKDSYGIGGLGYLGYDEWHDAKGIRLTRSDDFSNWKGYDTVTLNWNQVEKRVRELVDAGQYLSSREKEYLPEYEKLQLAREIYSFQYHDPNAAGRTYPHEWDFDAAKKQIKPLLDDPEKSAALYAEMIQTMAAVPPDHRNYDTMKRALNDMAAYQRGEYSLFTPLPEYALESERQKKQETKQTQQQKEPESELAAAARKLSKKRQPSAKEEADGQLTLAMFMENESPAQPEDSLPEAPEVAEVSDFKDVYRLLSRLKEDCDYFLGAGERQEKHLWAGSAAAQLDKMRELYALVPEKPEWLTEQELSDYAQRMAPVQQEQAAPSLTVRELFDQYLPLVKARVLEDTAYQNACKNSDPENVKIEAQAAIKRAALSVDSLDFQRLYHDHTTFHNRLHQQVWEETYSVLVQPQEATVPAPDAEKSPVTLYRETLTLVADAVRGSSLYAYLRDQDTDIDEAKDELDSAISNYMADIVQELESPASSDLDTAKRLIEQFADSEYGSDTVDFSDLEHIGIAYTTIGDEERELQVNVDLVHFSITQLVDGVCVSRQDYDSLRELIDKELSSLDFDDLTYLSPETQRQLEQQEESASEPVEIDGGRVTAPAPSFTYQETGRVNAGAFEVVFQELHTGPERRNFQITDDHLGEGGQKTKYQYNVAAIRTLRQIEAEGRLATSKEQEILSKYVDWGRLADAFDPDKDKWAKEYAELKELLTPEEYESAKSTVLNAHYTSPTVIKAIYEAVGRMDFTPGNVLEPSCGIGNFFGLAPAQLADAKLYGVELDSLTGRIARQLYQKADITIDGFERTDHPDDFFDLAVGNVPFGEYHVHDPRYNRQNLLIHDYFLTKTLDKVRPGGIVAFITTKGTMDKKSSKVREALAQKADLLGAIRLPNNAFKANAGTEVTADILFFQKRDRIPEKLPDWVEVGQTEDGVPLNRYFLQHPEMVLGEMQFWRNMYGNETETACLPIPGADLAEQLAEAVRQIDPPSRELLALNASEQETTEESIPADPSVRNFSYALSKGKLYFRENSQMKRVEMGKTQTERVKGIIAIRDCARELIDLQLQNASDGDISAQQAKLNTLYDQFTKKYGIINSAGNRQAFRQDSSYPLLCSLEVLDDEKQFQRKADMFHKRTIQNRQPEPAG